MPVVISGSYLGGLRVELSHQPSGGKIITDAPLDNHGKGEAFSPTDLVAAACGACIMTVIGIKAEQKQIDLSGIHMRALKHMQKNPRRIGLLEIEVRLPERLTPEERSLFEAVGHSCPVVRSLHPEIDLKVSYKYDL